MSTSKKSSLSEKNQPQIKIVRPDWGFWDKHTCTLLDGILLSLNICPLQYPIGKNLNAKIDQLFWYRQSAALDAMPFVDWVLDKGGAFPHSSGLVTIHLKKFALWVDEETNWKNIPPELIAIKPKIKINVAKPPSNVPYASKSRESTTWTKAELQVIEKKLASGMKIKDIAKEYGVTPSRISQIKSTKLKNSSINSANDPFNMGKKIKK
jgi:hypothetical protein